MKYIKLLAISAVGIFFLSSCASTARIEKDETVDFSKLKSYKWVDIDENGEQPKDLTERNLHTAISSKLGKAAWKEDSKSTDVIIKHDLRVEKKLLQRSNPVYSQSYTRPYYNAYSRRWVNVYYPSRVMGYNNGQYEINEGTLTITMVDAKTNQVIWQGWNTDEVNNKKVTSKELESSVNLIFKKFVAKI